MTDTEYTVKWRPIAEAPKDEPMLVRGGIWRGEWSGDTPCPNAIHMVDDLDGSISGTEYYSPSIIDPVEFILLSALSKAHPSAKEE